MSQIIVVTRETVTFDVTVGIQRQEAMRRLIAEYARNRTTKDELGGQIRMTVTHPISPSPEYQKNVIWVSINEHFIGKIDHLRFADRDELHIFPQRKNL